MPCHFVDFNTPSKGRALRAQKYAITQRNKNKNRKIIAFYAPNALCRTLMLL